MRFQLEFDCDNAAFEDDPHAEAAEVLQRVSASLEAGPVAARRSGPCTDSNGNTVGTWSLT